MKRKLQATSASITEVTKFKVTPMSQEDFLLDLEGLERGETICASVDESTFRYIDREYGIIAIK